MFVKYLLLLLTILPFQFIFGQAGTIDPNYADGAELRTINFLAGQELTSHSVTDSQDRTWIAGQTTVDGDWKMILTRLNPDGSYDQNFAGTGYAVIDLGTDKVERVEGIALRDDDLMIAGEILDAGVHTPFVISYTSEGSLNTDFGQFGAFVADLIDMNVTGMTIDPSGAIFLSGVIENNVIATKILADGSGFDQSFGYLGAAIVDFLANDQSVGIDLDTEGNVYIFGYGTLDNVTHGHVTSFTATGDLNTNFNTFGRKAITWPDNKHFFVSDGLIHSSNQKIYLSGRTRDIDTGDLNTAAVAIDLNAEQDMNFAQAGWMETDLAIGGDDLANAIEEGLNGIYIAVSIQEAPDGINSGILHLDEMGQRVETFGNSGIATVNVIQAGTDHGLSISFQSDDKVILVGIAETDEVGLFGYATRLLNDIPSSTKEAIYLEEMQVYPNPTSDVINISITSELQDDSPYTIFNIHGTVVRQGNLSSTQSNIDISEFSAGQYVLQIPGYQPQYLVKMNRL